jgi:hypothetical protein
MAYLGRWGTIGTFALVVVTSCATSGRLPPAELSHLDGYEALGPYPAVQTLGGQTMFFDANSNLTLELPGQVVSERYDSIHVHDAIFDGHATTGRQVQVPLAQIQGATLAKDPQHGLMIGLFLGALAVMAGGIVLLAGVNASNKSVPGRALRVRRKIVVAPLADAAGWRADDPRPDVGSLSAATRDALASFWTESARSEHASVPAFSRLSMTLMALGAPSRLVEAAHRAALDEIEHARVSFAMASAYAGAPVAPGPLAELADAPSVTATSLADLALESLIDGCLLEGVAAASAAEAAARASDPEVGRVLGEIARQEALHADLAWAIVGWCLETDGVGLSARLEKATTGARAPVSPGTAAAKLRDQLQTHGVLSDLDWRRLFERTRAAASERLASAGPARHPRNPHP